jgi:pimeloyl-ACP methyl ester carboxylesterase
VRARLMREKDSVGKEASLAIIKALFADDPVRRVRRYSGPVMIVTTPREDHSYDLHRVLPQLPSTTIVGTSHWPHLDKPDEFERVLDDFLAKLA